MYFKYIVRTYVITNAAHYAFLVIYNYRRISFAVDIPINLYSTLGTIILTIFTALTTFYIRY